MASPLTVLFVDTDQLFFDTYSNILKTAGYRTRTALKAHEAMRVVKRFKIHLVILDLTRPDGAGAGIIVELRNEAAAKNLPILVLWVLSETNELQGALEIGATDYLIKDRVTPGELLRKVRQLTVASRWLG